VAWTRNARQSGRAAECHGRWYRSYEGGDIREIVRSAFSARGITCEIEAIPGGKLADAATLALQRAKRNEVDAIVAGGGDGTITPSQPCLPARA